MTYTVAVRELCAFTAKQGDLDLRFSPSPTAQEGIAGHALIRARRPDGYEAEISLSGQYCTLKVRGRADGYDAGLNRLEEFKTYRGELSQMPENHRYLHWAQLKIYGHLLCEERRLNDLQLALVYFDLNSQQESILLEPHSAEALRAFFEDHCRRFLAWAEQELAHRARRNTALEQLSFPYAAFRSGQRQLAEAVYRSAGKVRPLLAQAPTGIGKTVGTLFPMLKACAFKQLDKVFFLTAKTSGRHTALQALANLCKKQAIPVRALELVARDKACEHPDKACHGESCPLANGFFDRLPNARTAALEAAWDKHGVRAVALEHRVCPYYLAQDLVRWADVVVADYNYYFDTSALLYALTNENAWRVGLLIDEAHNLVARARDMYSATLSQSALGMLRNAAPLQIKKTLDRLHRQWNALSKEQSSAYQAYDQVPAKLESALRSALSEISDYFVQHPTEQQSALQNFYFDALHFSHLIESFGEHSLFDISKANTHDAKASSTLCIRNVLPGPHLKARFSASASTVLFSATLSPWHFYSDVLGMENPAWLEVDSPFHADQLSVHVARHISTRFQDRSQSIEPIANLVASQFIKQPGNYLAFFSSFDYLEQVFSAIADKYPDIPLWRQSPKMHETERDAFLNRFQLANQGIGFAVLGGAFGEGVDLPGKRLIGAFIATLGLPQVNPVNQEMMRRIEAIMGQGYAYTYLFPGLQKVVQAAGRVIRTQEDYGTVHLMDDRFDQPAIRALLPAWWRLN